MPAAGSTKSRTKKAPPKSDNLLLAGLSHFSILAILLLGPFCVIIPLIIWLSERNKADHSEYIEFHAKQAFFFQIASFVLLTLLGILTGLLSIIVIGILLIPVLIVAGIGIIVYGVVGGIRVTQGENFRYLYVADFIDKNMS